QSRFPEYRACPKRQTDGSPFWSLRMLAPNSYLISLSNSFKNSLASGGRVAAVQVEVGVEVVGHFQPGFFQAGKRPAVGQQLGFERAPARLGLGVIVGVARAGVAGHRPRVFDTLAAGVAGVLAAAVGVNHQARGRLAQR
nr:hypothetical protein [Tanacetum cinerariifolium]